MNCEFGCPNVALKRMTTSTGYWVCYGCYIAYLEVTP